MKRTGYWVIKIMAGMILLAVLSGWNYYMTGRAVSLPEQVLTTETVAFENELITEKTTELKKEVALANVGEDERGTELVGSNPGLLLGNAWEGEEAQVWNQGTLLVMGQPLKFPEEGIGEAWNNMIREMDFQEDLEYELISNDRNQYIGLKLKFLDSALAYNEIRLPGNLAVGTAREEIRRLYGEPMNGGREQLDCYWGENSAGQYVYLALKYHENQVVEVEYTSQQAGDSREGLPDQSDQR